MGTVFANYPGVGHFLVGWFGAVVYEVGSVGAHETSLFASLGQACQLFVCTTLPQFTLVALDELPVLFMGVCVLVEYGIDVKSTLDVRFFQIRQCDG